MNIPMTIPQESAKAPVTSEKLTAAIKGIAELQRQHTRSAYGTQRDASWQSTRSSYRYQLRVLTLCLAFLRNVPYTTVERRANTIPPYWAVRQYLTLTTKQTADWFTRPTT